MSHPLEPASPDSPTFHSNDKKEWIHFEEENSANQQCSLSKPKTQGGAVIDATHVEITIDKRPESSSQTNHSASRSRMIPLGESSATIAITSQNVRDRDLPMQTISLNDSAPYREIHHNGHQQAELFKNGTLLATVLPEDTHCAWVTTPTFVTDFVPQELFVSNLTLTVEDYLMAMDFLVNDCRFNCYTVCYRRLIFFWILIGFCILMALLFSGLRGLSLFGAGIIWLIFTALGIFICLYIKKKINKDMENAVSAVNRILMRQNIMIGMEDRGKLSCHKIALPFVYFDAGECLLRIGEVFEEQERKAKLAQGLPLVGPDDNSQTLSNRLVRSQEKAEKLVLTFSQQYVKELVRKKLNYPKEPSSTPTNDETNLPPLPPRHCPTALCLCQFIEVRYFQAKPRRWYHLFI